VRKGFEIRAISTAGALFAAILGAACLCAADRPSPLERIASFTVDLTVRKDSSVEVREDFQLHSEEAYFNWGLVRYLPIGPDARKYLHIAGDGSGDTGIRIKILEVTEDGEPISYTQGTGWAYPQLRIGAIKVPPARGNHRIVIRYDVEGAITFLADQDELYWNALGYNWKLPTGEATIRVHLPDGMPIGAAMPQAFVGWGGFRDKREPHPAPTREDSQDAIAYTATHLEPAQSLSVDVVFPKGFVRPPRLGAFSHNGWMLAGPILIFLYYLTMWMRIGPEPPMGSVPVRYEPPAGMSPAAARYVRTSGCDGRTLAAVIAQLAVRECLAIELDGSAYKLTQRKVDPDTAKSLAPEESRVLELLFEDGPTASIHPGNSRSLSAYLLGISGQLEEGLSGKYVTSHLGFVALGFLASSVFATGMSLTATGRDTTAVIFLTGWFFFCASILSLLTVLSLLPAILRAIRGLGGAIQVLPAAAAIAVFGSVFVYLLRMLAKNVSPAYSVALTAVVAVNVVWAPFLRRRTDPGRQAMRDIEGFRLFLETAEREQMQRLSAASATPGAVSTFVPYAIALEVKEAWGDHLAAECYAAPTTR
jgi:Predicted membrane protein (DUF2207)